MIPAVYPFSLAVEADDDRSVPEAVLRDDGAAVAVGGVLRVSRAAAVAVAVCDLPAAVRSCDCACFPYLLFCLPYVSPRISEFLVYFQCLSGIFLNLSFQLIN